MIKEIKDLNNPDIRQYSSLSGYTVTRITELNEIEAFCYELEHKTTGARHIHISNSDSDNTFSVALRTIPEDSTGVAHILEHTALCGSAKYPVRDPFFSMIKRSLNTFMNAFTASDWTMYPFSTQNKKDYQNLMSIYLDAVFAPLLDELSFKQEGHRLELVKQPDSDEEQLVYKGIVYNEMKGAMSSPSQVMARSLLHALYPSTTYSFNSGGAPEEIPRLSHEDLLKFHREHYHPGNAFFYTYGNFPLKDSLRFIHENYLKDFGGAPCETKVLPQPRWDEPKQIKEYYPLSDSNTNSGKSQVCVAWLTADIRDSFQILALILLNHILIGDSGSPLRKALIDSKLGTSLCDATGYDSDNLDTMFAAGLKDVKSSDAPAIEKIIFDTLKGLVQNGIPIDLAEAAIHQVEFHKKEVTNSPYPYGIKLLLGITGPWMHGGDPVKVLNMDEDLSRIKEELANGGFFEGLIKEFLLENNHRVLFTLEPDAKKEAEETARVNAELDAAKANLTGAAKKKIHADAEALKALQESKEDLSCLPTLEINDIPKDIKMVKEHREYTGINARCYRQPTSGIFYATTITDVGDLPRAQMPLVPFFCSAFTRMGTTQRNYEEMAHLISANTGGISMSAHARSGFRENVICMPFVTFNGKCLNRNQEKMFEISRELLQNADFSNLVRLKSLLLEYRASLESSVIQNGHGLSASLASRNYSSVNALNELWHGVHQLNYIKQITDGIANNEEGREALAAVSNDLELIAGKIMNGKHSEIALVGEEETILSSASAADAIFKGFTGEDTISFTEPAMETGEKIVREGWSTESTVSFVASCFETVKMGHPDAAGLSIISKLMRSLYLHREIREKGGAYGGFSNYNSETGLFGFGSYRDPHLVKTLGVYDGAASFIRSGTFTEEDVKEAVLQVNSDIDKPDTPATGARKAFFRKVLGLTDEARLAHKNQLLEMTRKRVLEVAETYFTPEKMNLSVAVISGEEKLKEANLKLKDQPLTLHKI